MPYSKGHVCLCVFPRDGRGWEGQSGQGSKENSSLLTDQMEGKKKEEKGDYMLCNYDNRKENTGGLKCESLCPEEYKHQGWFDTINQNSLSTPESGPRPFLRVQTGTPRTGGAFLLLDTSGHCVEAWGPE